MLKPVPGVLSRLADMICAVECNHPVRVAIDGVDAAGKTSLADALAPLIEERGRPVIRASIDGFHNPRHVRYRQGVDSAEGYYWDSFNYGALQRYLLVPFGPDGDCRYQRVVFDFRADKSVHESWYEAPKNALLLFDGVFLLRPELVEYWDFSIFVDVDFDVSVPRAVARDVRQGLGGSAETVQMKYERRYVLGQQLYFAEAKPKRQASIIVDNNEYRNSFILPR